MVYFDNATTTFPKPASVYEGMCARFRATGSRPDN